MTITYDSYIGTTTPGIIQFENANEGKSYPFADNTTLMSDSGRVLDDSVVTDLHLAIPMQAEAYLSSVYISDVMISICFKIDQEDETVSALSCTIKASEFEPYTPYRLEPLTGCEDVGGIVTFGAIDFKSESGAYRFSTNVVRLADSVVSKYAPAKLRKIIDDRTGESVTGNINLDFTSYIQAIKESDGIKLNLTKGANDALLSDCDKNVDENPCGTTPIETINGVAADSKKRIVIWFH